MLRAYLNMHKKVIGVLALFGVIEVVVFVLYRLPVSAVGYAAAICAFFGVLFLGLDYGRFCLKHRDLQRRLEKLDPAAEEEETRGSRAAAQGTHKNDTSGLDARKNGVVGPGRNDWTPDMALEHLPPPSDLLEEDYQALLKTLCRERRELREEMEQRYREMIDYYTVWAHQIKTPIAAMRLMLQTEGQPGSRDGNGTVHIPADSRRERTDTADLTGPADSADAEGERGRTETNVRALQEELRRIEQYVEMVLCYLRLDANSTDYVFREYDLDEIVRQAVRRHASTFIQKKLRLEYEPLNARVVTDEKWLLFVIEQVLSNALKYADEGSISITLESPKTLCIRDTGIGIAPEDLPRIFEKGYTGDNGRSDKRASGIGLYLCSRICANLGHGLTVTSTPGQGTEVRLDLKNAELEVE